LQGEINKQRVQTKKLIVKHQLNINTFLRNAGYRYIVEIENTESIDYKLKLRHIESEEKISNGRQHLSFGEKNAFALVLFMYEALSRKSDLIILDDPISSFDKNKKYAIMHMLFRGEKCLKNKNVIMFTHDFDPVIDTVKILKEFINLSESKFLSTKNGFLVEKEITRNDILTFSQICDKVLNKPDLDILVKLIYLRRNYEIIDDSVDAYQVLSNLFHKREITNIKDFRKPPGNDIMYLDNFNIGVENIVNLIPTFHYDSLLARLVDEVDLKNLYNSNQNGYIKLQLFRLIYSDSLIDVNSVLRKFINETFHIENEMISQLDPTEFEIIPDSIVQECDQYLLDN
jgi:energy-coupling factor transporter ATP-binding protein EcfA2